MTLLQVTRGDRHVFDLALTDGAGAPLDLTARSLRFTAKTRIADSDADAVLVKTIGDGIELVDADEGTATLTIEPDDTSDIDLPRTLIWDLQVEDGAGDVRTPLRGKLAIVRDVTRNTSPGS